MIETLNFATENLKPPAFKNKARVVKKKIDAGNNNDACDSLDGLIGLTKAQQKRQGDLEVFGVILSTCAELQVLLVCNT